MTWIVYSVPGSRPGERQTITLHLWAQLVKWKLISSGDTPGEQVFSLPQAAGPLIGKIFFHKHSNILHVMATRRVNDLTIKSDTWISTCMLNPPGHSFSMWPYLPFWIPKKSVSTVQHQWDIHVGGIRWSPWVCLGLVTRWPSVTGSVRSQTKVQVHCREQWAIFVGSPEELSSSTPAIADSIFLSPKFLKKQQKTSVPFWYLCVLQMILSHIIWKFNVLEKNNTRGPCPAEMDNP